MAGAPQQGNQSDNSAAMLWWVAAIFAAIGAIWYGFKDYIVIAYLSMKLYEVDMLTWLGTHLNFNVFALQQVQSAILYARTNPGHLKFNELVGIGTVVGDWLRFPLMLLMFVLAIWVYFANTTRVFRRNYSMHDFAKLEKGNWPQITPVVDLDLINTDIDSGPW